MGQTSNYGFKQWENWEAPRRTALNEVLAQIDSAIDTKSHVVIGSYTGTGTESRKISLPFTPAAVLLEDCEGIRRGFGSRNSGGGLALPGKPAINEGESKTIFEIVDGGFQVYEDVYVKANQTGSAYYYLAFQ